ncbi:hypothetical protein [Streptomyces sp. TRM75563]|uniref:hypothetical protein n=1 Tax=Streptomyces sp. TRM75563 TaxID=2817418 RepID=UPI001F605F5C|nr:hypothetical protein [Streptomyces sp. TRM75563]MCI4045462.1 hypothetical protein [Streptomyces sp. TRM75563]
MNDNRSTYARFRNSAAQGLREAVIEVFERHEVRQAAAQNAVTSSTLALLASDYDAATTDQYRAQVAVAVAEGISLAEAGTIRRAAKAIELGMSGLISRAAADGMTPTDIARELGATPSYVRRILRETPAAPTTRTRSASAD